MKRYTTTTKISPTASKIRVKIEDIITEIGSLEAKHRQHFLLKTITENPELLKCGYNDWQIFKMHHTGERWLIEAEAVIESDRD